MTTVVAYKGFLAHDSRSSYNSGHLATDYTHKSYVNGDLLLASAGSMGEMQAFMREDFTFLDWDNPAFPKKWRKKYLKHIEVMMFKKGHDRFFETTDGLFPEVRNINDEVAAVSGSGSNFAHSAVHTLSKHSTMTPRQIVKASVEAAIKFDLHSGGDVLIYNLRTFKCSK